MKTTHKRNSFIMTALNAALEDLSETVAATGNPEVAHVAPADVTALANDEGPQNEIQELKDQTIALEDELNTRLIQEIADGGEQITDDLNQSVQTVAALESIADALYTTAKTKTATMASNAGFLSALQATLSPLGVAVENLTYGLEDASGAMVMSESQSDNASRMAAFAKNAASKLADALKNAYNHIVEFIKNFVAKLGDRNKQMTERAGALIKNLSNLRSGENIESEKLVAAIRPVGGNAEVGPQYKEFFQYTETVVSKVLLNDMQRAALTAINNFSNKKVEANIDYGFVDRMLSAGYPVQGKGENGDYYQSNEMIGGFTFWVETDITSDFDPAKDKGMFRGGVRRGEPTQASSVAIPDQNTAREVLQSISRVGVALKNLASASRGLRFASGMHNMAANSPQANKEFAALLRVVTTLFTAMAPGYISAMQVNAENFIRLIEAGLSAPAEAA